MPFVTTLTLESGDGDVLDAVVTEIKEAAGRKGAQFRGPHPKPPTRLRVPQYKRLLPGETFQPYDYTSYTRVVEVVGHDEFARTLTEREYPDSVHVTAEIEQVR